MTIGYRDSSRTAEPTDAEVLDAAYRIVSSIREFFITDPPGQDIIDVAALPFAKSTIVSAFRLVIATEPRAALRGNLAIEGSLLAQYQRDVGARILITPVRTTDEDVPHKQQFQLHLDQLFDRIAIDRRNLDGLFRRACLIAEQKFEKAQFHTPFEDDGTYTPQGHAASRPAIPRHPLPHSASAWHLGASTEGNAALVPVMEKDMARWLELLTIRRNDASVSSDACSNQGSDVPDVGATAAADHT